MTTTYGGFTSQNYKTSQEYWWSKEKDKVHTHVFDAVKSIKEKWSANYQSLVACRNRYEERASMYDFTPSPYSKQISNQYLSLNVTASVVDTLVSKIAGKGVPSVQYVTSGADAFEQDQAKDLEKFITGTFIQNNLEPIATNFFGDACKMGSAFILLDDKNGSVYFEEYSPLETFCDWIDAQYKNPVDIHFVRVVNRYQLMISYPKFRSELEKTVSRVDFSQPSSDCNDFVLLIKSYNRFARRHTVCVENCTLEDEEININDKFGNCILPYVQLQYKPSSFGLFSIGIAEELRSIHIELDKHLRVMSRCAHLGTVPKLFVPRSANIISSAFDNDIGTIVHYDGAQPPISAALMNIPPDLYQQINLYRDLAFEKAGLSRQIASSQQPIGLTSGRALESLYDIQSDRFQTTAKAYEKSIIDLNYMTIKYTKALYEKGYKPKARLYGLDFNTQLDFADVNIDEEIFDIQAFPVSIIPKTPAGRYEIISGMMDRGLLSPEKAARLMQLPDIETEQNIEQAQEDFVRYQLYKMTKGIPQIPTSKQNLDFVIDKAEKYFFYYKTKNLPDDKLLLISNYIEQAKSIKQQELKILQEQQTKMMAEAQAQSGVIK